MQNLLVKDKGRIPIISLRIQEAVVPTHNSFMNIMNLMLDKINHFI